jgi:MFS family permease
MVGELVGKDLVMNAVALNSSLFNASRIVGPALAGLVMGAWGIGWCFALNSLSFLPLLFVLTRLPKIPKPVRASGAPDLWQSVKDGVAFVRRERHLREVLVSVGLMGILGFNFTVLLPVLVKHTLGLGETAYGLLMSCMGVGSLAAALLLAARSRQGPRKGLLLVMPLITGALFAGLAFAPQFGVVAALMILVGFSNVAFFTTANSYLQVNSPLEYRGRVISFYSLLFGGTTPVGNLVAGSLVEMGGPALGFFVTGVLLAASCLALRVVRSKAASKEAVPIPPPSLPGP